MPATSFPYLVTTYTEGPEDLVFSPTQISTFLECARKWAWKRIEKVYEPPAPSAALGTETHGILERYLGEGEMPDHVAHPVAAKVASAGLHLLPAPKTPGMRLEQAFCFKSLRTGFVYRGLKDIELAPGVVVPSLELGGLAPGVIDHKTTSSIESYAKKPEDLLFDPQATIYAIDSMVRFDARATDLRWIYYQTKGANRSKVTAQRLEQTHASRVFDEIETVAAEAATALVTGKKPLDLEPNPSACSAYGGCPHRHRCNLSPANKARSYMASSLIADLKKRVQSAPEPVAEPSVEPASINPPESSVVPPAVEAPASPVEAKAEKPADPPKRRGRPKKDPVAADAHAATEVVDPKPASPSETTEVVASDGATQAEASGTTEPAKTYAHAEVTSYVNEKRKGFTLYVDCMPIGAEAKVLSSFFAKANEEVEKLHKVPDYRLVDYGKGAPLFAACVLEQVEASGKDVILDTRTPEGTVCLEALASKASLVVRGLR